MVKRWVMATLLSVALMVSVVAASVGEASASTTSSRKTVCVPVYATGVGQDFGTFTTANISVGSILVASTYAQFKSTGAIGSSVSFAGPVTFTAVDGLGPSQ